LIEYAEEAYSRYCQGGSPVSPDYLLSDARNGSECHGVFYSKLIKLPAIVYMHTGDRGLLEASINGFNKLDRDHMLVDGIPSCNEGLAGKAPGNCHETCVARSPRIFPLEHV
jgi:hypothetical protein